MPADRPRYRREDEPMTADGVINVLLVVVAAVVVVYLLVALIVPERF
ncbi:hypothetical protein GCM10022238_17270 [Gordonia hankookensis]